MPTPSETDNSTNAANTAWVNNAINNNKSITRITKDTNIYDLDVGLYFVDNNIKLYYQGTSDCFHLINGAGILTIIGSDTIQSGTSSYSVKNFILQYPSGLPDISFYSGYAGKSYSSFKSGLYSNTTIPSNDNSKQLATTQWVNAKINQIGSIKTLTKDANIWELSEGIYYVNGGIKLYYNATQYSTLEENSILYKYSLGVFEVVYGNSGFIYHINGTSSKTGDVITGSIDLNYSGINVTREWVNNKINIEYVASYPFPNSGNSFRIQLGNEGDLLNYNYKIILTSCSELPDNGFIGARFGNSTTDLDLSGTLIKTGAETTDWNTIGFTPMGYQSDNAFELMYNYGRGAELFADFNITEFNGFVSINGSYGRGIAGAKQTIFLNRLFNNATDVESVSHLHIYLEDNRFFNGVEGQILIYRSKK